MNTVVAIGIDAGDPVLLERSMANGTLPTLARLRRSGAYGHLANLPFYRAETAWTMFLTGVNPDRSAYWSPLKYTPDYQVTHIGAYDFSEYRPFYALVPEARVAAFDLPQTRIVPGVNGIQVVAWGAHSPLAPSGSEPPDLLPHLTREYGTHPTLESDEAPIYDRAALLDLRDRLVEGLRRRARVTADLLRQQRWDLFITMLSETHAAGHYLWHLSQPDHPLYASLHADGEDPLGDVLRAVDRALGEIAAAAPADATLVVFSGHGMEANSMDLPSMVFLPELLFRHSFPGRRGLDGARDGDPLPAPASRITRACWEDELYAMKADKSAIRRWLRRRMPGDIFHRVERRLGWNTPPVCYRECDTLHYQPAWWYRGAWPAMKAFALPSFSEGYIRVNLAGREQHGLVDPSDYGRVCDDLIDVVSSLRDGRTGEPLVRQVRRTRTGAHDTGPSLPDADLIVSWAARPTDVAESPTLGRIGPVPYLRTGSHVERGFVMVNGPGIPAGGSVSTGYSLDLAPTILSLMGATVPDTLEGRALAVEGRSEPMPATT